MLRNSLQRRLRMETLEDKRPLAANLFANVVNGDLVITGDAGDNRFYIQRGSPDVAQYEFGNLGDSADKIFVNGIESNFVSGVTGDIIINLGGGSDFLNIQGPSDGDILEIPGDLRINMGSGDDRVVLGDAMHAVTGEPFFSARPLDIAGDLVIDTGTGTDWTSIWSVLVGDDFSFTDLNGDTGLTFQPVGQDPQGQAFQSVIAGDFCVITGGGADEIDLEDINVGRNLLVSVDGGNDSVELQLVNVASATLVSMGAGNNQSQFISSNLGSSLTVLGSGSNAVTIDSVVTSCAITVLTGNGADSIGMINTRTSTATVTTGSGNDQFLAFDSVFDNLLISLDGGADTLYLGNTTVNSLALLLGGGGFDTLVDLGGNDFCLALALAFESRGS
jgi:hypothetical protein